MGFFCWLFCFVLFYWGFGGCFFPLKLISPLASISSCPFLIKQEKSFLELVLGFISSRAQKEQGDKGDFVVAQGTLFIAPHSCCYKRVVGLFFSIATIKCYLNGLMQQTF